MKVSDLGGELHDACIERGFSDDAEITPRRAVVEWCAWELGDGSWADKIITLYAEAKTDEREASDK